MKTDTKLLIAIIGSITSLAVAIVSLISSIITTRRASRYSAKLENIKQAITFKDDQLKRSVEALDVAISTTQRLKDELYQAIISVGDSIDLYEFKKRLFDIIESIASEYQLKAPSLNAREKLMFHQIKNLSLKLKSDIIADFDCICISNDLRAQLQTIRNELSDRQEVLRDSRIGRIMQRTSEIEW